MDSPASAARIHRHEACHRYVGFPADVADLQAEQNVDHGRVSRRHHVGDVMEADPALLDHCVDQVVDVLHHAVMELLQAVRFLLGIQDPCDHVFPEADLRVVGCLAAQHLPAHEVQQVRDDGRGADVDRHPEIALRRVARLELDHLHRLAALAEGGGDREIAFPKESAQHVYGEQARLHHRVRSPPRDLAIHPVQVAEVVLHARGRKAKEELAGDRIEGIDSASAQGGNPSEAQRFLAGESGFPRESRLRRDLDAQIAEDLALARQDVPLADLVTIEKRCRPGLDLPLPYDEPALSAQAVSAAMLLT